MADTINSLLTTEYSMDQFSQYGFSISLAEFRNKSLKYIQNLHKIVSPEKLNEIEKKINKDIENVNNSGHENDKSKWQEKILDEVENKQKYSDRFKEITNITESSISNVANEMLKIDELIEQHKKCKSEFQQKLNDNDNDLDNDKKNEAEVLIKRLDNKITELTEQKEIISKQVEAFLEKHKDIITTIPPIPSIPSATSLNNEPNPLQPDDLFDDNQKDDENKGNGEAAPSDMRFEGDRAIEKNNYLCSSIVSNYFIEALLVIESLFVTFGTGIGEILSSIANVLKPDGLIDECYNFMSTLDIGSSMRP